MALAAVLLCAAGLWPAAAAAQQAEPLVITATRISEDVAQVPAAVTVIGGDELRARGVSDLRGALALASGVDVAPGGDPGPAASVPEFWGLKEFDAFLLVVDGVPWGGAFNPALATLDLRDVERIEVIRGAAPVMYGATSFVGVVHVIHKEPSKVGRQFRAYAGSYGSLGGGASAPLSTLGRLESALSADIDKQGLRDPRTKVERDHAHWRGQLPAGGGTLKLNADAMRVRSNPPSPVFVQGSGLSSQVPLDSNQTPLNAYLNDDRYTGSVAFERPFSDGSWTTLLSYSHDAQDTLRGFLTGLGTNPDAHGFREQTFTTDLYFDTHALWTPKEEWKLVGGVDHLHGRGFAHGGDFDYQVDPTGAGAPSGDQLPSQADVKITDQRDFSGLYGFAEWEPHPKVVLEAGARLNRTQETRYTSNLDLKALTLQSGNDEHHEWRASGSVGATLRLWRSGEDLLNVFGSYRDTFKPAAVDFGLDTPARILNPETAQSWEGGVKSRWFDDHVDANVSAFQMDFRNLVLNTLVNGNVALENSGSTRFRGLEVESAWHPGRDLSVRGAYSLHDARLRSDQETIAGVLTDVGGKRLPLSARDMAAGGVEYAPKQGLVASAWANYVGTRFLDKPNQAEAKQYAVWNASAGFRRGGWEVRLAGRNINDQRPPVSASELGDSQVYLLPARTIELATSWNF